MKSKITIIHHCGLIGGAGVSLLQTVKILEKKYDVQVYCPKIPNDMSNFLQENKVNVKEYNFQIGSIPYYSGGPKFISRTFLKSVVNIFKYNNYWRKEFKLLKADLIIVNSMTLCWMGKLIQKECLKSVCFVRETLPVKKRKLIAKYINRLFYKYFNGIYFISRYDKESFIKINNKSFIIRNSVKKEFFDNLSKNQACILNNLKEDKFNVLFVGGMSELKGTHVIVNSAKYLPENVMIIIAGYVNKRGDTIDEYGQLVYKYIDENDMGEKVKFVGVKKDMVSLYKASDIVVFPATLPHQARPAFESGACGRPIVISDFEQFYETVYNEKNGLFFKPNDSKDLAEKILTLYNNKEMCKTMGIQNKKVCIKKHSIESVEKELLQATDRLIKK